METSLYCIDMKNPFSGKTAVFLFLLYIAFSLAGCGEFVGFKGDDVNIGKAQKLEVFLSDDNIYRLYNSVSINDSVSCSVIYEKWRGEGKIKVRGYTSRMHPKKSFQLKIEGKKYVLERGDGLGGVSNRIAMRAHQLAGLPACGTETVGLFLNDEYLGCYNLITYYDEDILGGELYKTYFKEYDHLENNHPLHSLSEKKFPDDDNFSNLENLLAALTTLSDARWQEYVLKNVDVEKTASYLAVHDFLLVNDTFRTNLYIAYNKKFYLLPWDNESCIGYNENTYEMGGDNHLTRRLVSVPEVKAAYNRKMKELFMDDGILSVLKADAEKMFAAADTAMKNDPNYKDGYNKYLKEKERFLEFLSPSGRASRLTDPVLP